MLHRDISPDNIIISETNEPILIDFGAAREDSSNDQKVTRMLSALRVVKDGYSPQEFYIAGSTQGPSCDLYSLAASFYHIITQEMPPDSQSRLQARAANEDDPYVSLGDKVEGYTRNFVSAMDKAIAILPNERMQSANDWLSHMKNEDVVSQATIAPRATPANDNTFPLLPVLLGSTAAIAVLAGLFLFIGGGEAEPENITTEVAVIPTLDAVDQPDEIVPTPTESAPEVTTAAPTDEAPAAPTDEAPVIASTEPVEPESSSNTSGVDFFVNMNSSQPDLLAAPRTNIAPGDTVAQPRGATPAPSATTTTISLSLIHI